MKKFKACKLEPILAVLSFLLPLFLYTFTLAPTVTDEDSGDFITSCYILGIPHPPGYPLYTMLGKLFTFLPWKNVGWRVNFMSAVFASFTTLLLFIFLKRFISPLLSFLSSLIFAFSREFWSQSVIAEVYTLHSFFLILLLLLTFSFREKPTKSRLFTLWFLMGLSLTNHHTAILYLPLLLWITLEKWREIKGKEKFLFFFFLLLGLLPYLYLPIRSRMDPPLDWGNPENFKNFFRVITRYQYGGFSVKGWKLEFLTYHIKKYLQLLFAQYSFLVFLGLGIIKGLKERKKEFIFLFLFYVLYSFFYALIVSFNPYIRHPSVHIGVFYIPSFMIFACFIGKGLEWCVEKEKKVFPLLWLLPLILLYLNLPYSSRRKDYTSYNYGMEVLSKLPPKSIVFVNHGDRIFIFWYLQWVEGKREDVIFLSIQSLKRPVYLERMRKLYPQVSFPSHEEIKRYVEEVVKNRYPPVFIVYLIIENIIEKNIYQRPIFSNEVFPQRKFKFVPCPPLYQIVKK